MIIIKDLTVIDDINNYDLGNPLAGIQNPDRISAIFIGSRAGTSDWNTAFIEHYQKEKIAFASPKIFQYTTVASIAGNIAKSLNRPIETRTFEDGFWPLNQCIKYLEKNPESAVLYYTFELISKLNPKTQILEEIKPGIAYCILEMAESNKANKYLPRIIDFELLPRIIPEDTTEIETSVGAHCILKTIRGITETTTLLYNTGIGNTALITIDVN